jgi:hypothetical protein
MRSRAWLLLPALAPLAAQAPAGRLETHDGLTIARVQGSPAERGEALGRLLGPRILRLATAELELRYARRPAQLERMRALVAGGIRLPADVGVQIDAMLAGMRGAGIRLELEEFGRDLDALDLRLLNSLDVVALLACSGFTATGPRVAGGGVLAARSFDWPQLGPHLLDEPLLVVEHPDGGVPFASVTWPGYLGTVTAINERGVALFVHVGNGRIDLRPRPGTVPTALAARAILAAAPEQAFAVARAALARTAPPAGYITRVVLPDGDAPELAFEIDADGCRERPGGALAITTNHFLGRDGARGVALDSRDRFDAIADCLRAADAGIDPTLAWRALAAAQRGDRHPFPTLHALVFRAEPWCCELRFAELRQQRLVAAPASSRRWRIPRDVLFRRP